MPATNARGERTWKDEQERKSGCTAMIVVPLIFFFASLAIGLVQYI